MRVPSKYADAWLAEHKAFDELHEAHKTGDAIAIRKAEVAWREAARERLHASSLETDLGPYRLA